MPGTRTSLPVAAAAVVVMRAVLDRLPAWFLGLVIALATFALIIGLVVVNVWKPGAGCQITGGALIASPATSRPWV